MRTEIILYSLGTDFTDLALQSQNKPNWNKQV